VNDAVIEYHTFKSVFKDIRLSLDVELKLRNVLPFLSNRNMAPCLPNLCILYTLLLTLPVSSATAERIFS
jgi:hypothetical protein